MLRIAVCLAAICLVCVNAESCSKTSDCDHERCKSGYHVTCVTENRANTCGCAKDQPTGTTAIPCLTKATCEDPVKNPYCRLQFVHCVDQECKCIPETITVPTTTMGSG